MTAAGVAGIVLLAMPLLLPDAPKPVQTEAVATPKAKLFPKDFHVWLLGFLALASMVPEGAILDARGLDEDAVVEHRRRTGSILEFPGATSIPRSQDALEIDCDVLVASDR